MLDLCSFLLSDYRMAQDDAFNFGIQSHASFYVHNFAMIAF